MSSYFEDQIPSSSQFLPPQSAQPRQSLFGGPSSDVGPLPSSRLEPPPSSIFGGPSSQDVTAEPLFDAEPMSEDEGDEDDEDDVDVIMRERPLALDYGSEGESFQGSDKSVNETDPAEQSEDQSKQLPPPPARPLRPRTYVLDRGLDLPSGVNRPNRWTGSSSTYHRVTADDRGAYNAILTNRARDLTAHLYNAHVIRQRARQNSQGLGEVNGQGQMPRLSKGWAAWPMPAVRVPRVEEAGRTALEDPETLRMPSDLRPSAELEEQLIARMLKVSKERFAAREWDLDEVRSSQVKKTNNADKMVDEKTKDDTLDLVDETPLRPVIQTDDDISRPQLRPLARNVISELDRLLVALHRSMKGRVFEYDGSESASDTDGTRSLSRSSLNSASRSRSRGRKRVRRHSRHKPTSSRRSRSVRMSSAADTQDESLPNASQSRGRSQTSRGKHDNIKSKLALRDWSEAMGLASMMDLPVGAVQRASKRCADLFGQDMTFRTFPEGQIERVPGPGYTKYTAPSADLRAWEFFYVENEGENESETEVAPSSQPPKILRRVGSKSRQKPQSRRPRSHPPPPEVLVTQASPDSGPTKQTEPAPSGRGKGPHRKLDIVCPIKSCYRHTQGFSRRWNLNLHLKRVHPGYTPRKTSNERSRSEPATAIEID
ncbi:hypothetical protein NUU61_005407 [Penicillium alfredii]|uniref:Rrn9 domain-containing protein n=1 Tax=Penicillium alfredii TaxID=1506179 RepID=A0A9W9F9E8_9EURO|nr:uncharacterized protein NUU61_005407 [Penicillium alfredii]KAJ5096051.1 hypothetical protein NUU61_005407 [Penicillium alfredii]